MHFRRKRTFCGTKSFKRSMKRPFVGFRCFTMVNTHLTRMGILQFVSSRRSISRDMGNFSSSCYYYKSNLRNQCRARWAKGKTGIGLDEHCANSYIPQHIYTIIQCDEHAGCRNLHSAHLALCPSCPLPT